MGKIQRPFLLITGWRQKHKKAPAAVLPGLQMQCF